MYLLIVHIKWLALNTMIYMLVILWIHSNHGTNDRESLINFYSRLGCNFVGKCFVVHVLQCEANHYYVKRLRERIRR